MPKWTLDMPNLPRSIFFVSILSLSFYGLVSVYFDISALLGERSQRIEDIKPSFEAAISSGDDELIDYYAARLIQTGQRGEELVLALFRDKFYPQKYFTYLENIDLKRYNIEYRKYLVSSGKTDDAIKFSKDQGMSDIEEFVASSFPNGSNNDIICAAKSSEYFYGFVWNVVKHYVERPISLDIGPLSDSKFDIKVSPENPCIYYVNGWADVGVDSGPKKRFYFSYEGKITDPVDGWGTHKDMDLKNWVRRTAK